MRPWGTHPSSPPSGRREAGGAGRRPSGAVAPGEGGLGEASLQLLRALAESYLPGRAELGARQDVQALLARVACALETFSRSFVELRRGYEEFGREMGVRTVQTDGPLSRARDAAQVLRYLLEPA